MSDVVSFQQECKIRDEKIVHGYTRSDCDLAEMDIPEDIMNLCFKYYFIERDEFDPNNLGIHHQLDGNILKHKNCGEENDWSTTLLMNVINNGKHEWIFKVYKTYFVQIGIYEADADPPSDKDFTSEYGYGYQISHSQIYAPDAEGYGVDCKAGDIIGMTLDLDNLTLRYSVNEKDQGIAFRNINEKAYKAAVYSFDDDETIELLNYKQFY